MPLFAETIDFQRDIQPILAEKCWHCHGADAATRQAGLRLDESAAALLGGDSGAVIIVGKPDESELILRVASHEADEVMPPPKENKAVTPAEQQLLRKWIEEGAPFAAHWAFERPEKKPLPPTNADQPIDAWVRHTLSQHRLAPSAPAAAHVLCRRLYLDLIGLPPSPQEVDEYMRLGQEATATALLASPRYGEKWARHWLDVARYSDTNGYEKDLQREQWVWRDWVVNALNDDKPYDQFIIEQIAGDLLPTPTQDQIIATGFLRNSMLNEEGAIVAEQFRMVEMFDRIDCVGKAVLGLSTQCAQCHSHKFDPLSHTEYYGMFAFLNNTYEAQSWIYTPEQLANVHRAQTAIGQLIEQAKAKTPDWSSAVEHWSQDVLSKSAQWQPIHFNDLGSNSGLNHPVQLNDESLLMLGHVSADVYMLATPELDGVTGLRLEALPHGDLPFRGPGRSRIGSWAVAELEVFAKEPGGKDWQKQKLVNATADFSETEQTQKDSKKRSGPVAFLIDGSDETTWQADRGAGQRNQASVAVVQFEKPLELAAGSQLKIAMRMGDMLGCARLSLTHTSLPAAPPVAHSATLALGRSEEDRIKEDLSDIDRQAIELAWIASRSELQPEHAAIMAEYAKITEGHTSVLHLAERKGAAHRATYLLDRGAWDQPQNIVEPHTPAVFHPLDETQPKDRLAFAKWLVDPRSPLAARVAVNRVWQALFGEGLVETSEDFGTRAAMPEHRELLDWLAVDFMEQGWSQKRLLKLIVCSETYKQTSSATAQLLEKDPRNRLLARGPRFRVDAEVLRDVAMAVSSLITHKLAGPSVIPPVPQNVLDYNYVYPSYWKPATGPERYRRTLYGFRKRSMPDPVMSNLDAPNGDFSCARRVRSNTPLAALTGLNETIFFESAQALGLRIVREGGNDDSQRADYAYRLCTGRPVKAEECDEVLRLLQKHRTRLAEGWLNPREIATGDPGKLPEPLPATATPQDVAAWTLVGRVLLNLDETMTKN